MKKRWPLILAYLAALIVQVGALVAAWRVYVLSTEKMMLMRYLVARNLELEQSWFSAPSRTAQVVAFAAIGLAMAAAGVWFARGRSVAGVVQATLGALLAGLGAWLLAAHDASELWALYAAVAAVWVALVVQCVVVAVVWRRRARLETAEASR